jgi:chemotaxis-related protein WspD
MSRAIPSTQDATKPTQAVVDGIACWRQIGVFGDRSCPELHKYVHCHNCPVHSAVGLRLLNQALPHGYRRERTDHFGRQHDKRDASSFSAVLFRVGADWLALPTRILQEATEFKTIHSLPHRRAASILGLANVRGELLICISLPHLLGLQNGRPDPSLSLTYDRLLVVQSGASGLAFPVNEVHGPHRFHDDEIKLLSAKPRTAALGSSQGVLRWQDRIVGMLDSEALLATCQRSFR